MNIIRIGLFLWLARSTCLAVSPALILTPYIKAKYTQSARDRSLVDPKQFLNVTSHSGYITVNEKYNSNLFFWYFPVAHAPVSYTPLIIWLQGGPGATSLAGLFEEIGPFKINNSKLELRQTSWGRNHSLLFVDNPVGAGYSFTGSQDGYIQDMDMCAEQLYIFLQQFLDLFPELRKAPLYIAGESYAGRYIPAFAYRITQATETHYSLSNRFIHLKGLILGSPVFNHQDIADYTKMFYQWGLIDSQGVLAVKPLQDSYIKAINDNDDAKAYKLRDDLLYKLQDLAMQLQTFNVLKDRIDVNSFEQFITIPKIREAIHVGNNAFIFSNQNVHQKLIPDFLSEITPRINKILEHCRLLVFCGQLDMTASCVDNAKDRRDSWTWSHRDNFLKAPRLPWWSHNTVVGYVKSGGGLTEVLVRDAGHLIPMDKPEETLQLISYFIRDLDLPVAPNYKPDPNDTPDYKEMDSNKVLKTVYNTSLLTFSIILNVLLFLIIAGLYLTYCRYIKNYSSGRSVTNDPEQVTMQTEPIMIKNQTEDDQEQ